MSGLAFFFRSHLESDKADTNDYNTSLRDCETKSAEIHQSLVNTPFGHFAETGDYQKWKEWRDKFLRIYAQQRFSSQENVTVVESTTPRNRVTLPTDEPASPQLETQNIMFVTAEVEQPSSQENSVHFHTPSIRSTHHHAERIRDIDLLAKSVTLLTCKAEKRFAFRQLERYKAVCDKTPYPMYLHTSTPALPRLTLGGFQEDGPLLPFYTTVLNFEMKQVQEDMSLLRQRAEYLEEDYVKAERIHVFFYGNYAETLESIFRRQQTYHLYFSIQNVPHKCVFPYPASDWYEAHDLSACCVCIGDRNSDLNLADDDDEDDEGVILSFDHPEMKIFVATGSRLEKIEHVSLLTPCREKGVAVEGVEIKDSPFCDLAEQRPLTVVPESDYAYVQLSDLDKEYQSFISMQIGQEKCHRDVMAVVVSFTPARLLQGGDWMMTVSPIDESISPLTQYQEPKPISMNIFRKDKEEFPHVRLAGDVIRMHRVEVKKYRDEIQMAGLKKSSFVVCRREQQSEDVLEWIFAASQNTETTESEKKQMQQLWLWGQDRQRNYPSIPSMYRYSLSDMRVPLAMQSAADSPGIRGDFSVMITSVLSMPPTGSGGTVPRGFLRVWDGTGVPISDPSPTGEQNEDGDPPPEALTRLAAICRRLGIDPPTQVTGRVVNVAIWENDPWKQVQDLPPGSFIRLRNTREEVIQCNQLNCLTVANGRSYGVTHITPIPDDCFEVTELLKQHDARRGEERNKQSGILPFDEQEPEHGDLPVPVQAALFNSNSLQDLLTSYENGIFTGRIYISSTIPSFPSISSIDKILTMADNGSYYYRFGLCIESESGDLADVIVLDPAAEIIVAMSAQEAKQRSAQALANLKSRLDDHVAWDCTIRSIMFEGTRMLLLASATEKYFRI